jgi:hypothetical protein
MEKGRQDKIDQDLRIRIKELEITLDRKSPESDLYRVIVDLA